jgi:hypothetical protein
MHTLVHEINPYLKIGSMKKNSYDTLVHEINMHIKNWHHGRNSSSLGIYLDYLGTVPVPVQPPNGRSTRRLLALQMWIQP